MEYIKKLYNISKLSFVFCIISFCLFMHLAYSLIFGVIYPLYINIIIFAIPFILFYIITLLVYKNKIKLKVANIITCILVIILPIIMIINFSIAVFLAANQETNDILKYNKVIFMDKNTKYIEHFPKKIPDDVSNIKFFKRYPFLQGGEQTYLMFKTNNIYEYINKFENKSKYIIEIANEYPRKVYDEKYYYPYSLDLLNLDCNYLKNNNFYVYIIDCNPYKYENWNHGYTYGIYISETTNEIIYFMENW